VRLVARHVLLELLLGIGYDREILCGDAVALRAVAVPPERNAPPTGLPGREDDAASDPRGEILLEDTPVDHLDGEMRHEQPPAGLPGRWRANAVWGSDLFTRPYGRNATPVNWEPERAVCGRTPPRRAGLAAGGRSRLLA